MIPSSHDVMYAPPAGKSYGFSSPEQGRGYSADDLAAEQTKQLDKAFAERIPELLDAGAVAYVEQIRQEERMKVLETKMRECLSPEHMKRAREVFRARAEAHLKAEAAAALLAAAPVAKPAAVVAAEVRVQSEKRPQPAPQQRR